MAKARMVEKVESTEARKEEKVEVGAVKTTLPTGCGLKKPRLEHGPRAQHGVS